MIMRLVIFPFYSVFLSFFIISLLFDIIYSFFWYNKMRLWRLRTCQSRYDYRNRLISAIQTTDSSCQHNSYRSTHAHRNKSLGSASDISTMTSITATITIGLNQIISKPKSQPVGLTTWDKRTPFCCLWS